MWFLEAFWGRLVLLGGLLLCSFFFSASESALFALKRLDREELKRRGGAGATAALGLLADPRGLLASVLFGNLVVNMLIFSISTVLAFELAGAGHHGLAGVFGVGVLMIVIAFGEIIPKLLALSFPMRLAPPLALVLQGFYGVITPMRVLLVALMRRFEGQAPAAPPHLAAEELSDLVELAGREGTIAEHERRLVQEAVDLAELRVSHIMTPRVDLHGCEASWPASRLVLLAADTGHGRFPIYRGSLDEIVGVADVFDALGEPTRPLGELAHPAKFVHEQKEVTALLAEFQAEGADFAVVADEFGGTAGLVTQEDIVEEVVGDIRSPQEKHQPPPVQKLSGTRYLLAGDLSAQPWAEAVGVDPDDLGVDRLGGLVGALLGRIPREGDTVRRGDLAFTVRRMRRRRVTEVLLEFASSEAAGRIGQPFDRLTALSSVEGLGSGSASGGSEGATPPPGTLLRPPDLHEGGLS